MVDSRREEGGKAAGWDSQGKCRGSEKRGRARLVRDLVKVGKVDLVLAIVLAMFPLETGKGFFKG